MRAFPTLIICWLLTGAGALLGSILGNAAGPTGLRLGAILGGALGLLLAVTAGRKLGWVPTGDSTGAVVGGLAGFGVAIPITLSNMHTPVIAVASCALAGVGALFGAGVARGWRSPR